LTFYGNLEIKKKLFIVNLFTVFIGIILCLIALEFGLKIYDNIVYKEAAQILNLSTVSIENDLKRIENLSMQIMADNTVQDNAEFVDNNGYTAESYNKVGDLLQKFKSLAGFENKNYTKSYIFIDNNGKQFSLGNNPAYLNEEDREKVFIETIEKDGKNVFIKSKKEESVLIASRLIRKKENINLKTLGVIAMKIDIDELIGNYISALPYDVNLVIYSENEIIYSSNKKSSINIDDLKTKYNSSYEIADIDFEKYFITYDKSSYTKWNYANLISYNSIFEKLQDLRRVLISVFILIFFIVILISIRFAIGITKPIEQLTVKMKQAEKGIFDFIEIKETDEKCKDEIIQLQKDFNYMIEKINYLINENYVKQIMIKDTQLQALQAQINPHFLYNTLESINWMAKINKMRDISIMVESLGNLLRDSIENKKVLVNLSEELNLIKSYMNIQKTRHEEAIDFSLNVDKTLYEFLIPKLILQPLVENSIHYGLEKKAKVIINIGSVIFEDYFEIFVEDDGPGVKENLLENLSSGKISAKGFGTGLKNIDERIKIIFGISYGLRIENVKEGTRVTISIPFKMGE
jgi:two-component system sensor histidine kinase YesM